MRASRLYAVSAFILKRTNIGETDKLLTVFTKTHGKIRVIAKGIRKITSRRGPHLDLFNEVKLTLHHGNTWDTVTEAETITPSRLAYTSWMRVRAAYLAAEIIDKLIVSNEPQPGVYDRLRETFLAIGTINEAELHQILLTFCNGLLFLLGFMSKEKTCGSLSQAVAYIERIAERKIRSAKFFLAI